MEELCKATPVIPYVSRGVGTETLQTSEVRVRNLQTPSIKYSCLKEAILISASTSNAIMTLKRNPRDPTIKETFRETASALETTRNQISEITDSQKTPSTGVERTKATETNKCGNITAISKSTSLVAENAQSCIGRTYTTKKFACTIAAILRIAAHSPCSPTEAIPPEAKIPSATRSPKTTQNDVDSSATPKETPLTGCETQCYLSGTTAATISAAEETPRQIDSSAGVVTPVRSAPTGALASHVRLRTRRQPAEATQAARTQEAGASERTVRRAWRAVALPLRALALAAVLLTATATAPAPAAAAADMRSLYKVALTQNGYIQYLRYKVDVPDLHDFTYCLWLRSDKFTHPQPIFSYSRDESERLVRGWLERSASGGVLVRMAVREVPVMTVLAGLRAGRWHHVCQGWDAANARWALHLDGALVAAGHRPEVSRRPVPGGGDLAVGQEMTDADRGLDDGIEGEVFGFNMVVGGGLAAGARLARQGFTHCAEGLGAPVLPAGARLLVAWPYTPVRVFGGATLQPARPICGDF